jgi:hypothetical protein
MWDRHAARGGWRLRLGTGLVLQSLRGRIIDLPVLHAAGAKQRISGL